MNHIAIDLGGRKSYVCVRRSDGTILQEKEIETRRIEWVLAAQEKARVIIETCAEGFGVADLALAQGHEVRVIPSILARALLVGARGIKTDRRDARALSEASCRIDLPSVHIPSQQARELKSMMKMRQGLVRSRTGLINQVRGYLRARRLRPRGGGTETFPRRIRALGDAPAFVQRQLEAIEHLTMQIKVADKELAAFAKQSEICRRLMTVPGVGAIVALSILATFDNPERFETVHAAESYLGIVPGENSSSERVQKTGITKAGSPFARWLLVQAAHQARRCRPQDPMVLWSRQVEHRRGRAVAVVALARKIAGILLAIWKSGQTYDPTLGARAVNA